MSHQRAVGLLALVALGLLLVACDEDGPGGRGEASGGDGGVGGETGGELGGGGNDAGGRGGGGGFGGEGPRWAFNERVFGSCDPEMVPPVCQEHYSYSCEVRDEVGFYVRRDCDAEGRICDFATNRCELAANLTECEAYCERGSRRCHPGGASVFECLPGPIPGYPPEAAHCPGFVRVADCPVGATCQAGECVNSCIRSACGCPDTLAPACGASGKTYWNACYRACAGVEQGEACSLVEWEPIWTTPDWAAGFVPTGQGRFVTNTGPNDATFPVWGAEYQISPLPLAADSVAEVVWVGRTGSVTARAPLRLPDGRFLAQTYDLDTYWSVVSPAGFELVAAFPANDGFVAESRATVVVGERVWISTPTRLLYLSLSDLSSVNAASAPYDVYDEDFEGAAAWGRLSGTPDPVLLTTGGFRFSIWDVDFERGVRVLRARFPNSDFAIGAADFREDGRGLWTSGIRWDERGLAAVLADYEIVGDCATTRSTFANPHPSDFQGGTATKGDVDDDGVEELVWATGSEVFVLERDEGGWLTIGARLPTPSFGFYRPAVVDLDQDGQSEIWLFQNSGDVPEIGVAWRPVGGG